MQIREVINENADYRGQHRAPGRTNGAPLHDLSDEVAGVYPEDIYGPNAAQYYGHYGGGSRLDRASIQKIQRLRGKPRAGVQIYRAVPVEVKDIHPGDWVTINRDYAVEHGEGWLGGKYKVLSKVVNAGDLYTDGNSIHEFGWDPAQG